MRKSLHCLATALFMAWPLVSVSSGSDSNVIEVRVVGPAGAPVENAEVSLVALYEGITSKSWHQTPGSILMRQEGEGGFQASVPARNRKLLYSPDVLVVVSAGDEFECVKLAQARLRCGVPAELNLKAHVEPRPVRVVGSDGSLLPDVTLSPAVWSDAVVPFCDRAPRATTGKSGEVVASWLNSPRLSMVYATGDAIGNQRVAVERVSDGSLQVNVMETRMYRGSCNSDVDLQEYGALFDTEIEVSSGPNGFDHDKRSSLSYSWGETRANRDLSLREVRLCSGRSIVRMDLPRAVPLTLKREIRALDSDSLLSVNLAKGIRGIGQVVDENSGDPLVGVLIRTFSTSHLDPITGPNGRFELWWHPDDRLQYFPSDVLGEHMVAGGFYLNPQELPVDGELKLDPRPMQPMADAIGKVVDREGNPVAGAEVRCEYKDERFTREVRLYSGTSGEFRFHDVLAGAAVRLTAKWKSQMTDAVYPTQLSAGARPVLKLVPHHAVTITGRIIDEDGDPIPRVRVTVQTPKEIRKEHFGGRDSAAERLFEAGVTDADGRFAAPPTIEWRRKVSLALHALGYRSVQTYWVDGSDAGQSQSELDFGEITMRRIPSTVTEVIRVIDADTKRPVEDARVACQGAFVAHHRGRTNHDGEVTFALRDGVAVVAAHADGYQSQLIVRRPGEKTPPIALSRWKDQHGTLTTTPVLGRSERSAVAKRLLAKVPPAAKTGSMHRRFCYSLILAYADFERAVAAIKKQWKSESGKPMARQLIGRMRFLEEDQIKTLLPFVEGGQRLQFILDLAEKTEDAEERLDLLGEAIVAVRQQTGDQSLYGAGRVAIQLLSIGEVDTATELLRNAFDDHAELARIREKGARASARGVARVFLPVYAIVDPSEACELIRLTAYADEVSRLQTLAVRFAAEFTDTPVAKLCEELELKQLSARGLSDHYVTVRHRKVEAGLQLADRCPDEIEKAVFLFELAKEASDQERRIALARRALELVQTAEPRGLQPQHWLAERVNLVRRWDSKLADEYLFAAFWLNTESRRITAFFSTATLAQHLGTIQPEAARALIEPCFNDWSWLPGDRDQAVMFMQIPPLNAAVQIDPSWAESLIDDLFDRRLRADLSRQLEVVHGVINSLATFRVAQTLR